MSAQPPTPAGQDPASTRPPIRKIQRPVPPAGPDAPGAAQGGPAARLIAGVRTQGRPEAPAEPLVSPSAPAAAEPARAQVERVTFQIPADLRAAARSAFHYTQAVEQATWSAFLARAVQERVDALSVQYNGGQPWLPMTTHLLRGPRT